MAWIDCQLPVGDEVYLYYGGYARGHKINRFEERQIGLVCMKRDRYVAREAGEQVGLLRTPLVALEGKQVLLNVAADSGEVRVRLVDENGSAVAGFGFDDCEPIREDTLGATVRWRHPLSELDSKLMHFEFRLQAARLFGIVVE